MTFKRGFNFQGFYNVLFSKYTSRSNYICTGPRISQLWCQFSKTISHFYRQNLLLNWVELWEIMQDKWEIAFENKLILEYIDFKHVFLSPINISSLSKCDIYPVKGWVWLIEKLVQQNFYTPFKIRVNVQICQFFPGQILLLENHQTLAGENW